MPWIELEGAANARDLGGLLTTDGGKTVGGRLLRSDNLQELSPADVAILVQEVGLTTVVDLRSTAELTAEGRRRWTRSPVSGTCTSPCCPRPAAPPTWSPTCC